MCLSSFGDLDMSALPPPACQCSGQGEEGAEGPPLKDLSWNPYPKASLDTLLVRIVSYDHTIHKGGWEMWLFSQALSPLAKLGRHTEISGTVRTKSQRKQKGKDQGSMCRDCPQRRHCSF